MQSDGYFVPDARMLEIGDALNKSVIDLKHLPK